MIAFRDLTSEDIDVRVQKVRADGAVLLLYKNARVDMNILDDTVGAENWQREHYECKGNLFCRVGINSNFAEPDKEARGLYKSDCGSESNSEPEKGEASDSFKRACFNWGIGRELYTCPDIFVPLKYINLKNGKCYDRFSVEKIAIKDKRIVGLAILNNSLKREKQSEKRCFVWQSVQR